MVTAAFVGKMYLERGDGGTPESFVRVCEIFSISGIGQVNALVDATTFCSNGTREYIAGLADGTEVSFEANYERASTGLQALITDVKNKTTRNFKLEVDVGSPNQVYAFSLAMLSWTLNPSVDGRNTITYTGKISGDVTIA